MTTKNEVAAKALDEARDIFKRLYVGANLNGPESDNFMRGMRKLKNAADSLTQSPRIEDRAAGDVEVKWSDELAALAVKMDSLRHLSTGSARFTYERAVMVLESLVEIERNRESDHGR